MAAYQIFSSRVRDNLPVSLATIIEGPNVGATLVVTPEGAQGGTLGNADIDRVTTRSISALPRVHRVALSATPILIV